MLMITQYHSIYPGLVTQTGHYQGDQEQDNTDNADNADNADQ